MSVSLLGWLQRTLMPCGAWRRRTRRLAGCAALALCTAWQPPAEAAAIRLAVSPEHTLTQAHALYLHKNTSSYIRFDLGSVPGGVTTNFYHEFPHLDESDFRPSPPHTYAIVGIQEVEGVASGVFGFTSDWPIVEEATFQELFTQHIGHSEESFIATLEQNPAFATSWANLFHGILANRYNTVATLVSFTDATYAGTAIAVVPEPHTWVLLVTGVGVTALVTGARRRR